jgi:hypothetical protein
MPERRALLRTYAQIGTQNPNIVNSCTITEGVVLSSLDGTIMPAGSVVPSRYYGINAGKGSIEMNTQKVRAGIRAFGRAVVSPLAEMERTVEFAAHLQQQLIRTDALPDARRERRGTR